MVGEEAVGAVDLSSSGSGAFGQRTVIVVGSVGKERRKVEEVGVIRRSRWRIVAIIVMKVRELHESMELLVLLMMVIMVVIVLV